MIRTDVVSDCPIYVFGLVRVLTSAGITVLKSRRSLEDGTSSILADVIVIDAGLFAQQPGGPDPIAEVAGHTPVLVVNHAHAEPEPFLSAGAVAVTANDATSEQVLSAVRAVATCSAPPAAAPATVVEELGGPNLSNRENQVLSHIARGLTHGQIATRIGISPHTVDTYVKRIRVKLGAGNKAELTRLALLRGLATPQGAIGA